MPPPSQIIEYLEKDLLVAINNDLIAVLKYHEDGVGGFHSIPREVFCYIDYIAALRYGENSSINARRFIEKYLGDTNVRYKHLGKLLYEMWRHGTVHEFDPKRLKHSSKKYSVGWQTNNDARKEERACHLECFKVFGTNDRFLLNVNLFQLVDDFVHGIQLFIAELKKSSSIRSKCQKNYTEISRQISVKDLKKCGKGIKRSLNLQIYRAVKAQRFEVQNGNVIGGKCSQ
jgi:hypothetical protein